MPRANRYYAPGLIWHIVTLARPWASRSLRASCPLAKFVHPCTSHKNIPVQNSPMSQARILTEVRKG